MENNGQAVAVVPAAEMEMSVGALTAQVIKIQEVMATVMKEGMHYGVIPGTDKPTLLKAGAEKLAFVFRLAPSFDIKREDLPGGHREYTIVCTLTHIPTGHVMGQGVGSCSSMEKKYRYRLGAAEKTDRPVPQPYWDLRKKDPARAQEMLGGKGFVTLKVDGQWFIAKKSEDREENPDLADCYNTVLKMGKKRSQVDATLTATACSDLFNQDLDELEGFAERMRQPGEAQDGTAAEPKEKKTQPYNPAGGVKPFPPKEPPKPQQPLSPQQAFWDALKAYCNNDNTAAGKLCNQLTGETWYTRVPEEVAIAAHKKFQVDYLKVPLEDAQVV